LTFSTTTTKKVTSAAVNKPVRLPPGFNPVTPFAVYVKEKMQNSTGERASEAVKKVAKSWKEMSNLDKNVCLFFIRKKFLFERELFG